MSRVVKITIKATVTVEVDVDAYEAEYGEDFTIAEIRDHIKSEVNAAAVSAFSNIEAITVK